MKCLPLALLLAFAIPVRADGPDDLYLQIYSLIEHADRLAQNGDNRSALEKYSEAEKNLIRLRKVYPQWNESIVKFRVTYLSERLGALAKNPAGSNQAPDAVKQASETSQTQSQPSVSNEEIHRLREENTSLGAKLQEALSLQPARLSPDELARAEEKIVILQKERDLLKVSLEQTRASNWQPGRNSDRNDGQASTKQIRELERERDDLRKQLDGTIKELADAEAQRDDLQINKLKQIQRERDELQKKLDAALKEISNLKQSSAHSHLRALEKEFAPTDATVGSLESPGVPLAGDELVSGHGPDGSSTVLFDPAGSAAPGPATTNLSKLPRKSFKDLPLLAQTEAVDGERDFAAGRFAEAEKKLLNVLKQDESNSYILVHVSACQLELGNLADAGKNLDRALALDSDDTAALTLSGILRLRQNKLDGALEALSRSAQLNPTNASTQNYLGIALSEKGQRVPAEAALRKAIELQPDYGLAHNNLAVVYASQKPPFIALARFHYQKAVALGEPKNPGLEKMFTGAE